jgi:hypothetical protein
MIIYYENLAFGMWMTKQLRFSGKHRPSIVVDSGFPPTVRQLSLNIGKLQSQGLYLYKLNTQSCREGPLDR